MSNTTNQDYYLDFYYIYVVVGANYIRPIIKAFSFIPKEANVVILTNTPGILKDVKVDFNLIVDDLEKYRDDWSKENEPLIDIDDEQAYMDEFTRKFYEEGYRFPCAINRFGAKWAIENKIEKFLIVDAGCKINFEPPSITARGFETLNKLSDTGKNLIFGVYNVATESVFCGGWINGSFTEAIKKHTPLEYIDAEGNLKCEEKIVTWDPEQTKGVVGFDGFCFGLWGKNLDFIKVAFDLWCEIVKTAYEKGIVQNKNTHFAHVQSDYIYCILSHALMLYYNAMVSHHHGIIRHFYHPENDFSFISHKMPHLKAIETKTRAEFLEVNKVIVYSYFPNSAMAESIVDGLSGMKF